MTRVSNLSSMRVAARVLVVLLTAAAVFLAQPDGARAARDGSAEQQMVQLINQARAATGARPLTLQADISKVAYAWSKHLAQGTELAHNPSFSQQICCWKRVAENVGYVGLGAGNIGGVLVNSMHQLFMNSPGHRANILNPAFDHVGIGVEISETRFWITVNFREWNGSPLPGEAPAPTPAPAPAPAPAPKPAPAPAPKPAPVLNPVEQIRGVLTQLGLAPPDGEQLTLAWVRSQVAPVTVRLPI